MLTGIKLKFDFYRAMIVCFFCYDALSGYVIALCNRLPLINYIGSYVPLIIIVLFVAINLLLNKPRRLYILDVNHVFCEYFLPLHRQPFIFDGFLFCAESLLLLDIEQNENNSQNTLSIPTYLSDIFLTFLP